MKKKLLVALLSLAMALSFTMASAFAVGKPTVTVETAADAVEVGATVVLRVSIKDNPGFTNFEWNIQYDKARLELKAIDSALNIVDNPNHSQTGFGYATCGMAKPYTENTNLLTLTFTVKADAAAGNAKVTIASDIFSNKGIAIDANYVAGGVTVNGTTGSTTGGTGSTTGGTGSTTGGTGSTTGGTGSTGSTTGGTGSTTGGTGSTTGGTGSTTGGTGSTTGGTGSTTGGTGSTTGGTGSTTGGTGSTTGGTGSTTGGTGSTVVYKIIEGANGSWTQNSDGTLTVRADGVFSKFKGVEVDGKLLIAGKDYTAMSGSTIVTLSKDYLATLSVGTHKLTVLFNDGRGETDFTVKAVGDNNPGTNPGTAVTPDNTTNNPQTGDHSGIVLAVVVLLVSGGALTVLGIAKKKAGKC